MQVTVRFFAVYRERVGEREAIFEVLAGATVADLAELVVRRFPGLGGLLGSGACAVNQQYAEAATALSAGDEVAFLPPVSGGAGGSHRG